MEPYILDKFHKCLVSPDRWDRTKDIKKYINLIKRNNIRIDSVMTSLNNVKKWENS